MKNIFLGLVALCVVLLGATVALGYADGLSMAGLSHASLHMLVGITAGIVLLAVHGFVILNYFIATGKAMDETLAGHPEFARIKAEGRKLKMKSSPAATMSCIFIIVAAVLGGYAWRHGGSAWHWGFAWFAIFYNLKSFRVEYRCILRNMELIEETRAIWIERKHERLAEEAAEAAAE